MKFLVSIVGALLLLPEAKKFLKNADHATGYEDVEVEFKAGKPPVLTFFDKATGEEAESISLENLTLDEMHELLTSRGFVRRADAPDLAEVKEKEAAEAEAAAVARKERAEAAAQRRNERGEDKKRRDPAESRAALAEKRKLDAAKREARESEARGREEL
eukprot:g17612.t1